MKYLALPAIILILTGPAHAGIVTTFAVNSAEHWMSRDQRTIYDGKVLAPFGGTMRSSLTPFLPCRSSFSGAEHHSSCWFDLDTSGFRSPVDAEYQRRTGSTEPSGDGLFSRLQVNDDGSYHGYFSFTTGNWAIWEDATGSYSDNFYTNYQFHFQGTGLAWDTAMDPARAEEFWRRETPSELVYRSQWYRSRLDPVTGDETILESDGWEGKLAVAAVPEPAAPALFGVGLAAIAGLRRRKRS